MKQVNWVRSATTITCLAFYHLGLTTCANILVYYGLAGQSHITSFWPVIQDLTGRGHNITILSVYMRPSSKLWSQTNNITLVQVPELLDMLEKGRADGTQKLVDKLQQRADGYRIISQGFEMSLTACSYVLNSPSTHALLYHSSFDLVIVDTVLNDCAVGLAALLYKCPFIIYNAVGNLFGSHDDFGLPVESSWLPAMDTGLGAPLRSLIDRALNTWRSIQSVWVRQYSHLPALSQMFMDAFNLSEAERPDFVELNKRTSLVLMNGHFAHGYALNQPPLFVSIAGAGVRRTTKRLPSDLEAFVNSGDKGFIYVSFGTVIIFSSTRPEIQAKFMQTFGNLSDLRFVWKWGQGVRPADVPPNIYFGNWLPQQDLLAHPKAVGFITHGGMNGVNEAVYHAVPMIAFPIMADQDFNAHALSGHGIGRVMEINDFTEQELRSNLEWVVSDKELRARVKRASAVFRDRPMKPLDTAVWWIEFVLRHKGDTSFLMPQGVHQTWYERRLLDVWLLSFLAMLATVVFVLYAGVKLYECGLGGRSSSSIQKKCN